MIYSHSFLVSKLPRDYSTSIPSHNSLDACIVGGQPIQKQAMELRGGVHVVLVGTPGRLNDCLEEAYLVLNQCSYSVLDEADRMIDLRFAPQIESILDVMGGSLKSEIERSVRNIETCRYTHIDRRPCLVPPCQLKSNEALANIYVILQW